MTNGPLGDVLYHLRGILGPPPDRTASDAELLERFTRRREETSFAALVRRHGGMVLGVCRRILRDEQDAEDAFQATFLVLAQKAASIRNRDSVGSWLYGVAYRVAARALAGTLRRRTLEQEAAPLFAEDPVALVVWRELRPILDEELSRLPERYRAPVVLCYLENKTQVEAARQLGCTKGTLSGRLARARDLLRRRLTRRGLALPGAVLVAALAENAATAVPVALGRSTVQSAMLLGAGPAAAGGLTCVTVTALVEGVLHAMWITKVKMITAALLAVAVLGSGTAWVTHRALADQSFGVAPPGVAQQSAPAALATTRARDNAKDENEMDRLRKENERLKKEIEGLKRALAELKGQAVGQATKEKPERAPKGNPAQTQSPDGRLVAVATGRAVQMLDAQSGRIFWKALGHQDTVTTLAFSPDGKVLVTGSKDKSVRLWDAATGKEIRQFAGQRDAVRSVAFAPDGRLLAVAAGRAIQMLDAQSGRILWKALGHQDTVTTLAFSPDGKGVATGGKDKSVRLWDVGTGKEIRRFMGQRAAVRSVHFAPDGKTLITQGVDKSTIVWDLATGKVVAPGVEK
jgi:RNA polymerase sigma factor (sigma-70 family)